MRFTIYGKDNCSFCKRAVNLCKRKGLEYTYIKLVELNEGKQDTEITKEVLESILGVPVKTVPQVVLHGNEGDSHIGGYDDLTDFIAARNM